MLSTCPPSLPSSCRRHLGLPGQKSSLLQWWPQTPSLNYSPNVAGWVDPCHIHSNVAPNPGLISQSISQTLWMAQDERLVQGRLVKLHQKLLRGTAPWFGWLGFVRMGACSSCGHRGRRSYLRGKPVRGKQMQERENQSRWHGANTVGSSSAISQWMPSLPTRLGLRARFSCTWSLSTLAYIDFSHS